MKALICILLTVVEQLNETNCSRFACYKCHNYLKLHIFLSSSLIVENATVINVNKSKAF
jgi:uncharacterized CHY-type Zn-finger protein